MDYQINKILDDLSRLYKFDKDNVEIIDLPFNDLLNMNLSEVDENFMIIRYAYIKNKLYLLPIDDLLYNIDNSYNCRIVFRARSETIDDIITPDCYEKLYAVVELIIEDFNITKVKVYTEG